MNKNPPPADHPDDPNNEPSIGDGEFVDLDATWAQDLIDETIGLESDEAGQRNRRGADERRSVPTRWLSRIGRIADSADVWLWILDDADELVYASAAFLDHLESIAIALENASPQNRSSQRTSQARQPLDLIGQLVGRPARPIGNDGPRHWTDCLMALMALPDGTRHLNTTVSMQLTPPGLDRCQTPPSNAESDRRDIRSSTGQSDDVNTALVASGQVDVRLVVLQDPTDPFAQPSATMAIVEGPTVQPSTKTSDESVLRRAIKRDRRGIAMVAAGESRRSRRLRTQLSRLADRRTNALLRGPKGFGGVRLLRWMHAHDGAGVIDPLNVQPPSQAGPLVAVSPTRSSTSPRTLRPCVVIDGPLMDTELLEALTMPAVNPLRSQVVEQATVIVTDLHRMAVDAQMQLHSICESLNDSKNHRLRLLATATFLSSEANEFVTEPSSHDTTSSDQICDALLEHLWADEVIVPNLLDRLEDLPDIVDAVLTDLRSQGVCQVDRVSRPATDAMLAYPWPGQFEELYDVVRSAARSAIGCPTIGPEHLPLVVRTYRGPASNELPGNADQDGELNGTLDEATRQWEMYWIHRTLRQCNNNRAETARRLGISRARLIRKLDGHRE